MNKEELIDTLLSAGQEIDVSEHGDTWKITGNRFTVRSTRSALGESIIFIQPLENGGMRCVAGYSLAQISVILLDSRQVAR